MASVNKGPQSAAAGTETVAITSRTSAAAQSPSASSAVPPLPTHGSASASTQAPNVTRRAEPPSSSHNRRRLHSQSHPPRIFTQLNNYNALALPDDSWLPRKKRHRHRHSLRHRDQGHLHTHSHHHLELHLHHHKESQQQQQQQLDRGLLDRDPDPSKPGLSEKDKEKRKYHHKRHASRDVRFPKAVRDHASMSLRPGKHGIRDKARGTAGTFGGGSASGVEELGVGTADSSAVQSFETNGLNANDSGSGTPEENLPFGKRRENVTMAEVKRERIRRMKEEESNRTSLNTLSTLSTTITRRLDTTYYSLLEKIANLHTTIYTFHALSTSAATLHSDFTHETDNLARDTTTQVDEFHSAFAAQIRRIESFEARMQAGAEKAAALNKRMEIVRQKIEAWDRREGEWQRRVTTRLRIFWAVVGTAVVVLVAAWGVQQLRPLEGSVGMGKGGGKQMGTGIGMGIGGVRVGVSGTNVSTANSTCGLSERGTEDGGNVWVDDTCSRLPFRE
ncbi:hypothetical protein AJ78_00285 [Emergomyces pasteurianus Ep9510]|uniref:Uncharacterized protein n=1 Tax=Emergomyces pasteurianus Ep9510 TaxID=1447872 RepID=A0A1J9PTQ6_9EURO|nr:hypothetical protein AJ78_00285 [Emergomyces pasteurianus Ep9510]